MSGRRRGRWWGASPRARPRVARLAAKAAHTVVRAERKEVAQDASAAVFTGARQSVTGIVIDTRRLPGDVVRTVKAFTAGLTDAEATAMAYPRSMVGRLARLVAAVGPSSVYNSKWEIASVLFQAWNVRWLWKALQGKQLLVGEQGIDTAAAGTAAGAGQVAVQPFWAVAFTGLLAVGLGLLHGHLFPDTWFSPAYTVCKSEFERMKATLASHNEQLRVLGVQFLMHWDIPWGAGHFEVLSAEGLADLAAAGMPVTAAEAERHREVLTTWHKQGLVKVVNCMATVVPDTPECVAAAAAVAAAVATPLPARVPVVLTDVDRVPVRDEVTGMLIDASRLPGDFMAHVKAGVDRLSRAEASALAFPISVAEALAAKVRGATRPFLADFFRLNQRFNQGLALYNMTGVLTSPGKAAMGMLIHSMLATGFGKLADRFAPKKWYRLRATVCRAEYVHMKSLLASHAQQLAALGITFTVSRGPLGPPRGAFAVLSEAELAALGRMGIPVTAAQAARHKRLLDSWLQQGIVKPVVCQVTVVPDTPECTAEMAMGTTFGGRGARATPRATPKLFP